MKHLNITVSGKVQGIFYRATAKAVADQLGIKGIIRNLKDGSVYIEAEGDDFSLNSFLEFCNDGYDNAIVDGVISEIGEMKAYRNFEVLRK